MAQRVVIPKGTVNPGETSVIEIPPHCQASNLVIAAPKTNRSMRQSSPVAGPSRAGAWDPDVSAISGGSPCPCDQARGARSAPASPALTSFHTAGHMTPQNVSAMSGASVYGTPRLVRRHYSPPSPGTPSYAFSDMSSVYDDTTILGRRRERQQVNLPDNFEDFQREMQGAPHRYTPEGNRAEARADFRMSPVSDLPDEKAWRAGKYKLLLEASNWNEMNDFLFRLENDMFEHDKAIYQKSRKNFLYNVSKVTCDAFKTMATLKTKKQRKKEKRLKEQFFPVNRRLF